MVFRKARMPPTNTAGIAPSRYFNRVIELKGSKVDAALYWKAFSQNRLGQRTEALTTIAELSKNHPNSPYRKQATVLEAEVQARHRTAGSPAGLGRRRGEADGAAGAAEHGARRGDADAREGARRHVVAQGEAAGAVRAGAEQVAARARSAAQLRQGIVDAGAPEPGDPVSRRARRTRSRAPSSPRSTARPRTST